MKRDITELSSFFVRYLLLIVLGLSNLYIIYSIASPFTFYSSFYILSIFYDTAIASVNSFTIDGTLIALVSACVAGSAYYLLLILNLSSRMTIKKRIKSILLLIIVFFLINVFRIVLFSHLYVSGFEYFDLTHRLFWNFMSVFLVICLWFVNVYIFKINSIPFYSDIKEIYRILNKKRLS